jgi:hypothetical protein
MAKLISGSSASAVWLDAAEYLHGEPRGETVHLFLEVKQPTILGAGDRKIIANVDEFLKKHKKQSIQTVAGTIFPMDYYRSGGKTAVLDDYPEDLVEILSGRGEQGWGNYFLRMVRQPTSEGQSFDQLSHALKKLRQDNKRSCFEVSPGRNYENWESPVNGADVPIYDPALDSKKHMNLPCLSHLSFTRDGVGKQLHLNATYRSHYYVERALGNLIGLAGLLAFMAKESSHEVGTLAINATFAKLDWANFRGKTEVSKLLVSCRETYNDVLCEDESGKVYS